MQMFWKLLIYARKIESDNKIPDLVCCQRKHIHFDRDSIDNMITHIVNKGLDTLVAANLEMRGIWLEQNEKHEILNDIFMPRNFKNKIICRPIWTLLCNAPFGHKKQ